MKGKSDFYGGVAIVTCQNARSRCEAGAVNLLFSQATEVESVLPLLWVLWVSWVNPQHLQLHEWFLSVITRMRKGKAGCGTAYWREMALHWTPSWLQGFLRVNFLFFKTTLLRYNWYNEPYTFKYNLMCEIIAQIKKSTFESKFVLSFFAFCEIVSTV